MVDFLEDLLEDLWAMIARVLSVITMVLWYDTASRFVTFGGDDFDGRKEKLIVFWALSITYVGSFIVIALEQLENDLKARSKLIAAGFRDMTVECIVSYSDMLQDSFAFVTGCAWTDVVVMMFASLSANPSWPVVLKNFGIAGLIAAGAIAWFVVTGNTSSGMGVEREAVERYFVTNSFAFFTGWILLVAHRNALACVEIGLESLIPMVDTATGLSWPTWFGDYGGAWIWVVGSTFIIFWLQNQVVQGIAKRAGVEYDPRDTEVLPDAPDDFSKSPRTSKRLDDNSWIKGGDKSKELV